MAHRLTSDGRSHCLARTAAVHHQTSVSNTGISHEWEGTVHYNRDNPQLAKRLSALAPSAILGTGLGIAEWVYWRFNKPNLDRTPILFIEASWAFAVDPAYTKIWDETSEKRPHDAIGGPMFALKDLVSSLLHAERARRRSPKTSSGGPARQATYLAFLARHVLPKARPFDDWLKNVVVRLADAHPKPQADAFGKPVPRQALDPSFAYSADKAPALFDQFLRSLDWRANPYLRSPDEMVAEGFSGEPYRYKA